MEQTSQGFATIGYNAYVKCLSVEHDIWVVQQGRPIDRIPAAQYGKNTTGYAICIGGNYHPKGAPFLTTVSEVALKTAAAQIHQVKLKCPNLKYLMGHRDVETEMQRIDLLMTAAEAATDYGTACPGDNLFARLDDLRKMTGLARSF